MDLNLKILIGPNGSGKTTYINKIENDYEEKYKKKYKNFRLDNENLDILHHGKKSLFNIKIEKWNKIISSNIDIENINKKAKNLVNEKIKQEMDKLNEDIKNNEFQIFEPKYNIKIMPNTTINNKIIDIEWKLKLNNHEVNIQDAPSGVKRMIILYLQIINELKDQERELPKLLIIEEIENHLHPSWIKICISLLKKIFDKFKQTKNQKIENQVIVSTHNPEVVVLFKDYLEYFVTPREYGKNIKEINWQKAHEQYEEINKNIKKHAPIDLEGYKLKVKTRLTLELARFMFCKDSPIILCEGITDQIFISKNSNCLVTNSFGYYNFGLYISLYIGIYDEMNKYLKVIADGDGKLDDENSDQKKLKNKLEKLLNKTNVFYFKKNIENDLYGNNEKINKNKSDSWKKFKLLEENFDKNEDSLKHEEFWKFIKN